MAYVTKKEMQEMFGDFAKQLEGVMSKRDRKYAQQFEALQDDIGDAIDGFSEDFLDELIAEAEDLDDEFDEDDDEFDDDDDEFDDDDEEMTMATDPRVLREMARLQRQTEELKALREADLEERENEREELHYQRMMNNLERQLQGQVANPRQFLQLLDNEGILVEVDGELMIAGEDEFGETADSLLDALPDLLDDDDYAHFAPARPGTGTGASQSGQNYMPQHQMRYFKDSAPSGAEIQEALNDPGQKADFFKELDSLYS
jgi:hypothetical protein